jgi:hypothetical protein
VEPQFLAAAFEAIEAGHGGWEGYLTDRLGLSLAERAAIRAKLLGAQADAYTGGPARRAS